MASHQYNIAVLGAGVMGLSAAHALQSAGHTVTIFDPAGFPAQNASTMAGGMLAPWSEIEHMPQDYVQAGLDSIALWKQITPVIENGSIFIAHDEDKYILERFAAHLPQDKGQRLTHEELQQQEPGLTKFSGGLLLKEEAHLNPQQALQDLIKNLQNKKAEQCENEADFDYIIDCRGYTAAKEDKDLRGVKGETIIIRNPEFSLSRPVRLMHPRYPLYIVPRENNIFMIGATVIEGAGDHVCVRSALELLSAAYSLHPSFAESQIVSIQAGIRPSYADNLPRIKINGTRMSCNGLFRHGFLLAPVMAQCVADYVDGAQNKYMSLFNGEPDERNHQRHQKNLSNAA